MPTEVSRRRVRLNDPQLFEVTLISYDDGSVGVLSSADNGTPITAATMPTGGSGPLGWLSAIVRGIGEQADAEATGNGGVIGLLKRLRSLLDGSTITTQAFTILQNAALSDAIDLAGKALLRVHIPSTWVTATVITFQVSPDNVTYNNLYDDVGTEVQVTVATSRAVLLDVSRFTSIKWIKIRSGTSGAAVNQTNNPSVVITGTVKAL